jgi:ferredoxin-NADP reductase
MSTHGHPDWQTGRVVEAVSVTPTARRITIERSASRRAAPGTHVDVRVRLPGDQRTDTRSYSVVESNADGSRLTVTVLRVSESRGGSAYMHDLEVGDTLETTQPLQNFPLRVGAPRYLLVAGGIGITAIVEMARVLASVQADYELVYVGRSRELMAYLDTLKETHGDRLRVHVDDEGTPLDVDRLVESIASDQASTATELYMCGPIRLMDGVRRAWETAELSPANLRYETFGNSGWFDPEDFVVRIPELGIETMVGSQHTMLEALAEAGADLMYDCRKGECGLCRVGIEQVDGAIDHRDVFFSRSQHESNRQLCTCVSRAVATESSGRPPVVSLRLS